jgi:Tol biopolymer transport system component/tRNA A-37 threonylcarbamoyl transferase component Bud32
MTLAAGTKLGPYEILSPLGAGGMGEVYKARDAKLGRNVAVKVLPEGLATDADSLSRFEREARAVAALSHPNILSIFDFGRQEGIAFAVMELLDGETLRERLSAGALPTRKAIEYGAQIARGLAAAHEKGIVHRDLKPENIFITGDGRVKILDFGLAKVDVPQSDETKSPTVAAATQPGTVMGTVGYMSPEQVRGKPADQRSDIFSFGSILFEMLTGERAFRGDSAAETMAAIAQKDPPEVSGVEAALAPGLDRIVRHCLEKSPSERFQSASDLAFDLESAVGRSSGASAVRSAGPRRRRWLPLALSAIAIAGLALGVGFLLGRGAGRSTIPRFSPLTFRRGTIRSARFAPDGQTIVYGAAWQGSPIRLFTARRDSLEAGRIDLPDADIFAINRNGEMAVSLGRHFLSTHHAIGTLAVAPLSGGAPRETLEKVEDADWSPDGKELAVVHDVAGRSRLELPIGKVLYESVGWLSHPRVSPDGTLVAFFEHPGRYDNRGTLAVVDRSGKKRMRSTEENSESGLAWSPDGKEVWYSAGYGLSGTDVFAIDLRGRRRVLYRATGDVTLLDASRDGRTVLARQGNQREMRSLRAGETQERDLSWLDWTYPRAISRDGNLVLFDESGYGGGPGYSVFVRKTDGSPAVRLGEGNGQALSPDGKLVISVPITPPYRIVLLPTGAGQPRRLEGGVEVHAARWFPDGKRILLEGHEDGHGVRLYGQDLAGGGPRPITPEGVRLFSGGELSNDGRRVAAVGPDQKAYIYSTDGGGGEPTSIPGWGDNDEPCGWTEDDRGLYVYAHGELPARVVRLDLATGKREPFREVLPTDPAGVVTIVPLLFTPDGRSYVYSYPRILSQLYVGEGLQ